MEVHWDNYGVRFAMLTEIGMTDYKPTKVALYSSGAEARKAGLHGIRHPSRAARIFIQKLARMRGKHF